MQSTAIDIIVNTINHNHNHSQKHETEDTDQLDYGLICSFYSTASLLMFTDAAYNIWLSPKMTQVVARPNRGKAEGCGFYCVL